MMKFLEISDGAKVYSRPATAERLRTKPGHTASARRSSAAARMATAVIAEIGLRRDIVGFEALEAHIIGRVAKIFRMVHRINSDRAAGDHIPAGWLLFVCPRQ